MHAIVSLSSCRVVARVYRTYALRADGGELRIMTTTPSQSCISLDLALDPQHVERRHISSHIGHNHPLERSERYCSGPRSAVASEHLPLSPRPHFFPFRSLLVRPPSAFLAVFFCPTSPAAWRFFAMILFSCLGPYLCPWAAHPPPRSWIKFEEYRSFSCTPWFVAVSLRGGRLSLMGESVHSSCTSNPAIA